ncbi:MAG: putative metal-binding motif-containing protein [Archangium sp.]
MNRIAAALVFCAVVLGAACSTPSNDGAMLITVQLRSGVKAKCVTVTASDGTVTRTSEEMRPETGMMSLKVGAVPTGLKNPVKVQAHGFLDLDCTMSSGENSVEQSAEFANPPTMVTLTLGPPEQDGGNDAGADAGTDAGADAGVDAGTDAGTDAGIDMDMDGVPASLDCLDTDPTVYPGAPELCGDANDNDCDPLTLLDCANPSCMNMNCGGQNVCTGGVCVGPNENCLDGVDNNGDFKVDCFDPLCAAMACNDQNLCTGGETCQGDGGCGAPSTMTVCTPTEPQCQGNGVCQPDSGVCVFLNMTGACDDGLMCTSPGTCMNGACVQGPTMTCGTPPTCRAAGSCGEPSGMCSFPPLDAGAGVGTCSDNNNCTINDACDGDGGCAGQQVNCAAPTQCHVFAGTCDAGGGCDFNARTGLPCDAGAGMGAATCDMAFACNVTPTAVFPFTTSNFVDADLPDAGPNPDINNCNATIDTTGATPTLSGCLGAPPTKVFTPAGGQATVLIRYSGFRLRSNSTLIISGDKPVIFAVVGNADIEGPVTANNGGGTSTACSGQVAATVKGGGAGGSFGSPGGNGGNQVNGTGRGTPGLANGQTTLIPLRGGCNGGDGVTGTSTLSTTGAAGGGAVQFTVSQTLTISNFIAAPGRGGVGAVTMNSGGSGGGSGGAILLEATQVNTTGGSWLTANGGGGGEGTGSSGGNSGSPGESNTQNGGAAGGGNSGSGGDGGRGRGVATAVGNGNDATGVAGGGGGGGGMGRIRINASSMCNLMGMTSADVKGNGTTGCPAP